MNRFAQQLRNTSRPGPQGRLAASPRGAFVLVGILVLVMLISMVAVSLLFRLKAEDTAVQASAGLEQSWAAAMSGVEEAMRLIRKAEPGSIEWRDNPSAFRERLVFDDGSDRWYFTIYSAPDDDALGETRFGLTDEASKLNLNTATSASLARLPRLKPALVDGLMDFVDDDDTPRPEGAEQEYYDTLPRPYAVRNAPLSTVGELLLVRGFTPALCHGEDANMNFRLDANEDDGEENFPPDNKDGRLDPGLSQYFTVSSYELDEDNDGLPRTDLNDPEAALPTVEMPSALTNYIAMLRKNKVALRHPSDLLEDKGKFKDDQGKEVELASGVGPAELPQVLDLFTTSEEMRLEGLINVNTASLQVLQTVPGIDEPLAEAILSGRRSVGTERRRSIAWLYQESVVNAEQFKKLAPHLTARSFQFSFRVAGYGVPSGRFRVLDVIIDRAEGKPVITYLRDLTRLGLPFKIDLNPVEASGG